MQSARERKEEAGHALVVRALDEEQQLVLADGDLVVGLGRVVVGRPEHGEVVLCVCAHAWMLCVWWCDRNNGGGEGGGERAGLVDVDDGRC